MKSLFTTVATVVLSAALTVPAFAQLNLIIPDGGEQLIEGSIVPIMWGGVPSSTEVDLEFTMDDGVTWHLIESGVTGGKYLWNVVLPDRPSLNCRVRVSRTHGDLFDPERLGVFDGVHPQNVNSVDVTADGSRVATVGSDGDVAVFDAETYEKIWSKNGHSSSVILTRFSNDGSLLVTGSMDGTAALWDVETGDLVRRFDAPTSIVWPADISNDNSIVVTGNDDGTITYFDVATGNVIFTKAVHNKAVRFAEFTPDGSRLVVSSSDGSASILNARTGNVIRTFHHSNSAICNGIQITLDNALAVTAAYDGRIKYWDAETGELLKTDVAHGGKEASEVRLSKDGRYLASAGYDGRVVISDPFTQQTVGSIRESAVAIRSAWYPDNNRIVVSLTNGKAVLWRLYRTDVDESGKNFTMIPCSSEQSSISSEDSEIVRRMNLR